MIPLSALFGKADVASLKVSPGGKWISWLARNDGFLDLWLAPLPLESKINSDKNNNIPGAIRVTATKDRDICFSFQFTKDDRRIIYLQETQHGSELYHPYMISLDDLSFFPMKGGTDLLSAHPKWTCAVGFVGGLQMWFPSCDPNKLVVSTGHGSLLWDLSEIDLQTGCIELVIQNPVNSYIGIAKLLLRLMLHLLARTVSTLVHIFSLRAVSIQTDTIAPSPSVPLQYFVDGTTGKCIGRAECAFSWEGIAMQFTCRSDILEGKIKSRATPGRSTDSGNKNCNDSNSTWLKLGPPIPLSQLNMQLIGSGGATGTMRFDVFRNKEDTGYAFNSIGVHTCGVANTTAYVEYPLGKIIANDSRADIDGFISNPQSGVVEAVLVTAARMEVIPLGQAGEKLKAQLVHWTRALGRSPSDELLMIASRTISDDVWILVGSSDTEAATYFLIENPYEVRPVKHNATVLPRYLITARPALRDLPLVRSTAVQITTRDGDNIPSYLTVPTRVYDSGNNRKIKAPLALFLHGGPSARDYAGFNPVVQLLAARCGVAVLTVNYRGSTGFGMEHLRKGDGVQTMHNDVEDARQWAIRSGIADEDKVVIMGASWGGYLSLGAATGIAENDVKSDSDTQSNKKIYAGVVGIVPLVCVGAANTSKSFRGDPLIKRYFQQIYGPKLSNNIKTAKNMSPLYRMQQFKSRARKLLLIHGENDPRVAKDEVHAVTTTAREMSIPCLHIGYGEEGHSIRKEPNVIHMWHSIEQFVCECVELPKPPAVDPKLVEGCTATVWWNSLITATN